MCVLSQVFFAVALFLLSRVSMVVMVEHAIVHFGKGLKGFRILVSASSRSNPHPQPEPAPYPPMAISSRPVSIQPLDPSACR
jgi:hypothetical protein